jgi:Ricin-type beta-trefoil lectin domain
MARGRGHFSQFTHRRGSFLARLLPVLGAVIALVPVGTVVAPAYADQAVTANHAAGLVTTQPPGSNVCAQVVYPQSQYAINAQGARVAQASASTGTVTMFHINGSDVPVTTPPANFNAGTASAATLKNLGIPARPESGTALTQWTRTYAAPGHRWYTPQWMCVGKTRNQPTSTSENWSGLQSQAGLGLSQVPAVATGPVTLPIAGKCLDDTNDSTANGNKIQIWSCNGDAAQQWSVQTNGTITINGKCLDDTGGSTKNGTKVQLYACIPGDLNQQWAQQEPDDRVVSLKSLKCLDDTGGSKTNGTAVQIWSCLENLNQAWSLPLSMRSPTALEEPAVGTISEILGTGPCLDDEFGLPYPGTPIVLESCNGSREQQWTVSPDGTLGIVSRCLDVAGGGTANGQLAEMNTCTGSASQQWQFRADGAVVNLASGKCLDDPNSNLANGTRLQVWSCNLGFNQGFFGPFNWPGSGLGGMYTDVSGDWIEPTFVTACRSASGYSMWVGLGGYGQNIPLLQNGTDVVPTGGPNDDYAWWETLGSTTATQFPETPIDFPVGRNDVMAAETSYNPANDKVTFVFNNITLGLSMMVGPVSNLNGHNVIDYYNGNSAEIIAERPEMDNSGHFYQLRKPRSGYSSFVGGNVSTYFTQTVVQEPDVAFHEDPNLEFVDMTSDGSATGKPLSTVEQWQPDPFGDDTDTWSDVWGGCH